MATPSREDLSRRLHAARVLAGLSQADLATKLREQGLRLGRDTLGQIERGVRERVSPHELRAIAEACELPPEFLLDADYFKPRRDDVDSRLERLEVAMEGLLPLSGAEDDVRRTLGDLPGERTAPTSAGATRASGTPHR